MACPEDREWGATVKLTTKCLFCGACGAVIGILAMVAGLLLGAGIWRLVG